MANVGRKFFPTGEEVIINIVNLDNVTENRIFFEQLLGLSVPATPVAQFWYEQVGDIVEKSVNPIKGSVQYSFSVEQAVKAIENAKRDPSEWKKLKPETEALLIASCCEVKN